ncbi:MAG TPA: amidohydrolase family protein [Glycomyces sp.]|nr:amidohydrolase family protein [Glycomyces sp.]
MPSPLARRTLLASTAAAAALLASCGEIEGPVGLSTEEVLAGATSKTADAFGLDERGRIAAGKRGDLVLIEATEPEQVIGTGAVAAVWKNGHAVELEAP